MWWLRFDCLEPWGPSWDHIYHQNPRVRTFQLDTACRYERFQQVSIQLEWEIERPYITLEVLPGRPPELFKYGNIEYSRFRSSHWSEGSEGSI